MNMQTKLTLRLDESLIQQAKKYAKVHDKSLSQVVADYFHVLTEKSQQPSTSPITDSLIGILDPEKVSQLDYKQHLADKYL
jgi:hypothetical protein